MARLVGLLVAVLALLAAPGCGKRSCKQGTILVELTRNGAAASADHLQVTVAITGGVSRSGEVTIVPAAGSDTLEVDFPSGYPEGVEVTVSLLALAAGSEVASATTTQTLSRSCDRLSLVLGESSDAGNQGGDASPDFAGCVPAVTACPASVTCGRVDDGCGGFVTCSTPCQLSAVTPRVANTGDVVVLEGTFSAGASLDFPGAPGVPLTLAGAHRATALVPATATAGDLVVQSGSTVVPAGTFRRASYTLGLQSLDGYHTQIEGGKQNAPLALARHQHAAVVVGKWLYLLGGNTSGNGTTATAAIERRKIYADGALGPAEALATTLAVARIGAAPLTIGNRIYLVGGRDTAASLSSLEYADVAADGTLSSFTLVAGALGSARAFPTASVVGDAVYVIGGNTGALDVATVERAPISATGELGAFAAVPALALMQGRSRHTAFVTSSRLVVAGGSVAGTPVATVEVATILTDGSIGAFATAAAGLPAARADMGQAQWGATLYAQPYVAAVGADGVPGAFTDPGLPAYGVRETPGMRATVVRDGLYLSGGTFDGSALGQVARAGLARGAALGAFAISSTISLPEGRNGAGGAVIGDRLYVLGGSSPAAGNSAVIYSAPINADDSLGVFTATSTSLATPRSYHGVAVAGGRVFIVGGATTASAAVPLVESAPINADDSLGSFTGTSPLTIARQGHGTVVINSALCVVGGYTAMGSPAYTNSYECAPVSANGMLGAFAQVTDASNVNLKVHLGSVRGFHATAVLRGELAAIGGTNNSPITNVESVGLFGWPGQAFNPTVLAGVSLAGRTEMSGLHVGDWLYLLGDGALSTTVVRADLLSFNTPFSVDAGAALAASLRAPTSFLIGNRAYVIGGIGGGGTLAAVQASILK